LPPFASVRRYTRQSTPHRATDIAWKPQRAATRNLSFGGGSPLVGKRVGVQRKTGAATPVCTTLSALRNEALLCFPRTFHHPVRFASSPPVRGGALFLPANLHPLVLVSLRIQNLRHDAQCRTGRRRARRDDWWRGRLRGRADARCARLRRRLHGSAADYRYIPVNASADALRRSRAGPCNSGCGEDNRHQVSHISSAPLGHASCH